RDLEIDAGDGRDRLLAGLEGLGQPLDADHGPANSVVMRGLVPGIHVCLILSKSWMAGTRARLRASFDALCPAVTENAARPSISIAPARRNAGRPYRPRC